MERKISAHYLENNRCKFTVWAPFANQLQLLLKDKEDPVEMKKDPTGYWHTELKNIVPGSLYKFQVEDQVLPDPASRSQPQGVHEWSEVVDSGSFKWTDSAWKNIPLPEWIIYELHVGTFTTSGTFKGVEEKLDYLKDLGINCIEIMPVSRFPGSRNWGYDGVYPFAVQDSYGGVEALKNLVNACHEKGIAIILDVVYNHMGPEGNYLEVFGPYFTEKYHTPWGKAINFDDKYSDEVRNFFIQNTLMWLEEFHFDGLRLDAVHEIIDRGARHFLRELREWVDILENQTGKEYYLIAETDLNDSTMVNSYSKGGYGLDAQWVDDFHHSMHTIITGEKSGYYQDFGNLWHLAKSFKQAFVYDGIYSSFRKRTVGNSPLSIPTHRFVICIQNHDQVGNRMLGERLSHLVSFEARKLTAGTMLMAPYIPMLFMGEEYSEDRYFQYFVSHGDKDLVKAVQEGRKREFKYFLETSDEEFPDPQAKETFERSKLSWNIHEDQNRQTMFSFYKELIRLRRNGAFDLLKNNKGLTIEANEENKVLEIAAQEENKSLFAVLNFNSAGYEFSLPDTARDWKLLIASAQREWGGSLDFAQKYKPKEMLEAAPTSLIIFKTEGN